MKKVILATAFLFALSIGVSVPVAAEEVARVTEDIANGAIDQARFASSILSR